MLQNVHSCFFSSPHSHFLVVGALLFSALFLCVQMSNCCNLGDVYAPNRGQVWEQGGCCYYWVSIMKIHVLNLANTRVIRRNGILINCVHRYCVYVASHKTDVMRKRLMTGKIILSSILCLRTVWGFYVHRLMPWRFHNNVNISNFSVSNFFLEFWLIE